MDLSHLFPADMPVREDAPGVFRVVNTRVGIEFVFRYFRLGCSPEEVVMKMPTLELANVYLVCAFYLKNTAACEQFLADLDVQFERSRQEHLERFPAQKMIRERLLARRKLLETEQAVFA